jgi:carbonic anhydrase
VPEHLIEGLRRFRRETFPRYREHYRRLVEDGQRPSTLFIGCADSRVVPDLLMDTGPGELFIVRNMGAFVPPFEADRGFHGTSAAIEYAVLSLAVTDIVVCGHSHCGAVQALYAPPNADTPHIQRWLELGEEARVPEAGDEDAPPSRELLHRTEQRSVALQVGRLLSYPMVRERVEAGSLSLHGWLYVIEDGQVLALDVEGESFVPLMEG